MEQEQERPDYEQARIDLAARIAAVGFSIESHNVATRPGPAWKGDDRAGHYAFTLRAPASFRNRQGGADPRTLPQAEHKGFYSVGSGILATWAGEHPAPGIARVTGKGWESKLFRAPLYRMGGRLSVAQAEQFPAIRAAYRPDVVDVVASMLSDASSHEPEMSFREWIDADGLEWSHPADAVECFEAIRETARFLRRVLSPSEFDEMRDLAGRL